MGSPSDLKEVAENMNKAEVKLNVIAIDFCNELEFDDPEEKEKAIAGESPEQQNNKTLLQNIVGRINGKIFPANVAMNIYQQFRKRAVHPVAKYRGTLEISKELSIQVAAYSKTKTENLPTLSKYSLVAEEGKFKLLLIL